jgi:hypothetical protein
MSFDASMEQGRKEQNAEKYGCEVSVHGILVTIYDFVERVPVQPICPVVTTFRQVCRHEQELRVFLNYCCNTT